MPTSAINLRIDADLKSRVSTAAESAGLTLTEYVIQALTHLTAETHNPWAAHPYNPHRSPRRTVVRGDEIFDRDRDLLQSTRNHCSHSPGPDRVVVRLTVPKGLNIGRARLNEFRAWQDLCSAYVKAIEHPRLEIRRLHIYDTDAFSHDKLPIAHRARLAADFALEKGLQEASGSTEPNSRVCFRYATVRDVMGFPGRRSDREYLNDFNVYGSLAVSFTLETSYGLPSACIVSDFAEDITYWTQRFDDLFDKGQPRTSLDASLLAAINKAQVR